MLENRQSRDLITSFLVAIIIPIILGVFAPSIIIGLNVFFDFFLILFSIFILFRIVWDWVQNDVNVFSILLRYLRPVPPGAVYNSDLKKEALPLVTIGIIAIKGFLFLTINETIKSDFIFLPIGNPTASQKIISIFSSAFLHIDFAHLAFNMILLWGFGSALEPRIGWKRYVLFYFGAILGSNLLCYILLTLQSIQYNQPELISNFHSLGASGAVAGIMGLFIVRCYFAQVSLSVPILFFPLTIFSFFSFSMRINAPILVGLFFAFDLSGSIDQYQISGNNVNYWAHVGGYLTCIIFGISMGLHREADIDEIKTKAQRFSEKDCQLGNAELNYNNLLKINPNDLDALKFLFMSYRKRGSADAGLIFNRLLAATLAYDIKKAADLCREYAPMYLCYVSIDLKAKLGIHFYRNGELNFAKIFLEPVAETCGDYQPKAMLLLAKTLSALQNPETARFFLDRVIEKFPGTLFESEAEKLLTEL